MSFDSSLFGPMSVVRAWIAQIGVTAGRACPGAAATVLAIVSAGVLATATTFAQVGTNAPPAPPLAAAAMAERLGACVACHGREGRTINAEYLPRIAGKPAGYLFNQLLNFRDGRRNNTAMSHLLQPLSDAYLREIADYFSQLELPYAAPPRPSSTPQQLQHGEALVLRGDATRKLPACAACHGTPLTGVTPAIPGLLGLPAAYISAQLGAWRAGQRKAHTPDCMGDMARALQPEDINAIASWLASQPVPAAAKPIAALPGPLPLRCGGVPQ